MASVVPERVKEATGSYFSEQDLFAQWMNEKIVQSARPEGFDPEGSGPGLLERLSRRCRGETRKRP